MFHERARQKKAPRMNAAHSSAGEVLFALPVEGLDNRRLHEFAMLCSPSAPSPIVTQQRVRAIGIEASAPMTLLLSEATGAGDDAASPKLHADRAAYQQPSQARRSHKSRHRDRRPRFARGANHFDNRRYLTTKTARSGYKFGTLKASVNEKS